MQWSDSSEAVCSWFALPKIAPGVSLRTRWSKTSCCRINARSRAVRSICRECESNLPFSTPAPTVSIQNKGPRQKSFKDLKGASSKINDFRLTNNTKEEIIFRTGRWWSGYENVSLWRYFIWTNNSFLNDDCLCQNEVCLRKPYYKPLAKMPDLQGGGAIHDALLCSLID